MLKLLLILCLLNYSSLYASPNNQSTILESIEVKKSSKINVFKIKVSLTGNKPPHIPNISKKDRTFKIQFSHLKVALNKKFYIDKLAEISLAETNKFSELQINLSANVNLHDTLELHATESNHYYLILTVIKTPSVLGTFENPIIDSKMSWAEAMNNIESFKVPLSIIRRQKLISVKYYAFDHQIHQGQLVIDERLTKDVMDIFNLALEEKFLFHSVIPIAKFNWDDEKSMAENNTSGFNYRRIKGKKSLSKHAYGQALDINPLFNPFIHRHKISPPNAHYNKNQAGTLSKNSSIVKAFINKGWIWGGNWKTMKDYQHFQKRLK